MGGEGGIDLEQFFFLYLFIEGCPAVAVAIVPGTVARHGQSQQCEKDQGSSVSLPLRSGVHIHADYPLGRNASFCKPGFRISEEYFARYSV